MQDELLPMLKMDVEICGALVLYPLCWKFTLACCMRNEMAAYCTIQVTIEPPEEPIHPADKLYGIVGDIYLCMFYV